MCEKGSAAEKKETVAAVMVTSDKRKTKANKKFAPKNKKKRKN